MYSQVLLACVRLDVFDRLARGPETPQTLSDLWAMPPDSVGRLLDAAVALELLEQRADGRYDLGRLGAPMVGNRAIAAMVEHHEALYRDLVDPVALLRNPPLRRSHEAQLAEAGEAGEGTNPPARGGALARYWAYAGHADGALLQASRVAEYSALMSASQPLVADELLRVWRFGRHRCLLDVGGGDGTFLERVGRRYPALRLMLLDLPAVADRARARLGAAGLEARASVHGGSFLSGEPLPQGADLITLLRVIHDHDDAAAMQVLRAVRAALPAGGVLLLAEPMAATPGARAMGDAYFGWYLLAMGQGRPRSAARLTDMLREAGFTAVYQIPTAMPLQTGVLVARVNPARPGQSGQ